jgi:NADH-quinone oxidoreductase subunit J
VGVFGYIFLRAPFSLPDAQPAAFVAAAGDAAAGNSQAVAWSLFTQNLLPFEIASIFLLVAMIGAVVLGRRQ